MIDPGIPTNRLKDEAADRTKRPELESRSIPSMFGIEILQNSKFWGSFPRVDAGVSRIAISGALRVGLEWSETRRYHDQDQQPLGNFNSDPFFGQSPIDHDRGCLDRRFAMSDCSHPHSRAGHQFAHWRAHHPDSYEAGQSHGMMPSDSVLS
jgi:hypothetical protein